MGVPADTDPPSDAIITPLDPRRRTFHVALPDSAAKAGDDGAILMHHAVVTVGTPYRTLAVVHEHHRAGLLRVREPLGME